MTTALSFLLVASATQSVTLAAVAAGGGWLAKVLFRAAAEQYRLEAGAR